jgi:hypothetical protein
MVWVFPLPPSVGIRIVVSLEQTGKLYCSPSSSECMLSSLFFYHSLGKALSSHQLAVG